MPRIESAWKFTQKRGILTDRYVPLEQFVKGHIGFIETLKTHELSMSSVSSFSSNYFNASVSGIFFRLFGLISL